ncbi:hypothetical protein SAM9427_37110 (plasmid) [Streptomyces sp. ETH9427]|uniref:hypothetical protein n=1 Tax=Streptomyces sp. E1N211 TaxID=1851876 RepID=UPI000E0B1BFE|nr:hypothetical protein [Streptomyces sp. E1N211]AXI91389.1 hypothetical protein SAM9427_37110 [Streptomyces sp. ETH9427]
MSLKPPYDHIADYPMPIVSAPQPVSLDADLPGAPFDPAVLDGDAWWVRYVLAGNPLLNPGQLHRLTQSSNFPAVTTTDVCAELAEMSTNAYGSGRPWPGLVATFDAEVQVAYVRYGAWLWADAGAFAYARVS